MGNYSLSGIRSATTAPQTALLARAHAVLEDDPRCLGAWVGGSFWTGEADPFSDVDVHCVLEDEDVASLGESWRGILARITPTVLAVSFGPTLVGGYSVTPGWQRIDLVFHGRSDVGNIRIGTVLFDRVGLAPSPMPQSRQQPHFPLQVVEWFFYILGHLVVVIGREELALGISGALTVRDTALIPLLLAERGIVRSGGAKRLNRFLSLEQRETLERLPQLIATTDSLIDFHVAVAEVFMRRGRALAARTGSEWPDELESACLAHLQKMLGVTIVIE